MAVESYFGVNTLVSNAFMCNIIFFRDIDCLAETAKGGLHPKPTKL